MKKRGALELREVILWIIILVAAGFLIYLIIKFGGKGESIIAQIKSWLITRG